MIDEGLFLALEGGEGSGKSTQARLLAEWLRQVFDHEVVVTFEPGATPVGAQLRTILLDHATGPLSPRTEALLYAADRAEHVATVVLPALLRGAIVITDRFMDSSIAYQGAGRELKSEEVESLSLWAIKNEIPSLTFVLDIDPAEGLRRAGGEADRLEAEPLAFHRRVREAFLARARAAPQRYIVVDARESAQVVHLDIRRQVDELLAELDPR